jgi:signal transduction histidine kinase/integral membrane sensor domain MASE1
MELIRKAWSITCRRWWEWLVVAALCWFLAILGMQFTFAHPLNWVWSPTAGVSLALVLRYGFRHWPGFFLGAYGFLVHLSLSHRLADLPSTLGLSLLLAAAATTLPLLHGWLTRRLTGAGNPLESMRGVLWFSLISLLVPLPYALFAVQLAALTQVSLPICPWLSGGVWWMSTVLGYLVLTPLFLSYRDAIGTRRNVLRTGEMIIWLLLVASAGILSVGGVISVSQWTLPYPLFALMMWGVVRFRHRPQAVGLALLMVIAAHGISEGLGPFAKGGPLESLALYYGFFGVLALTCWPMAAALAELDVRARTLETVQHHSRSLLQVIEQGSELMGLATIEGKVMYLNPHGRKLIGLPEETPLPSLSDLFSPGNRDYYEKVILPTLLKWEKWSGRGELLHWSSRSPIPVDISAQALRVPAASEDDAPSTIIAAVMLDRREQVRMENARRDMDRRLRLQDRLEAVATLTRGAAHEINNPLSGILGYAEVIHDSADADSPSRHYAQEIIAEGNRIRAIVKELQYFAQPDSGSVKSIDLAELVQGTLTLARTSLRRDGVQLVVHLSSDLPPVMAPPQHLRQILLALLQNAQDALNARYPGSDPGKRILISAAVDSLDGSPMVRLTVEDHGPGIPAEVLPQVFDPFFSTKYPGSQRGLGLSSCHGLLRPIGGRIDIDSEEGEYTRVSVILPAVTGG